ncbi:amino acid ABC transporter substrate-binding protein (PAAT family) [Nitrospirillum amazonense]|uniref:Amino acid ABC transporter substrate-binding protein (PAAT family) n=1 Tax=Nitrospirillum amazonense TaxID=28077 RepID=A0A560JCU1_9PROT|nr:transporter substrate-binding domain-containing protein [Nitrospirillum amazonense]TWB68797.1 amino acid ABC transporter substrate-binding protein (PAAT family) [Nitrospirillum amazonense]
MSGTIMDRRALLLGAGSAGLGVALGPYAARAVAAPLRFVYADNVVPFSYADADGNATGLLKDDVDIVTSAAGYSQTTSLMPWGRAQAMVRAGQADGFCTVPSADRAAYVQFCLQPVMTSDIGIWHRRDDDRFKSVGSLEELAAFRLGSYVGNGWATEHMDAIPTLAVVPEPVSVLKMLAAGRIDAFVHDELQMGYLARAAGLTGTLAYTPRPFLGQVVRTLAIRRSLPDCAAVVAALDAAILARRADLDALARRVRLGMA